MTLVYVLLTVCAGAGLAAQAVINAELRAALGSAQWAALISFTVGLLALGVPFLVMRDGPPDLVGASRQPWWIWIGGALGAAYILLAIFLTPRLGAALLIASVIVGQLVGALVIDHYGWFGVPVQRLTVLRVVGGCLLLAGAALIRWR
ncbi:MAG: DMT family transporter [Acidobacteria bacterium]|nr:DMT family transporter [Acidobacteriota bacterium]